MCDSQNVFEPEIVGLSKYGHVIDHMTLKIGMIEKQPFHFEVYGVWGKFAQNLLAF